MKSTAELITFILAVTAGIIAMRDAPLGWFRCQVWAQKSGPLSRFAMLMTIAMGFILVANDRQ